MTRKGRQKPQNGSATITIKNKALTMEGKSYGSTHNPPKLCSNHKASGGILGKGILHTLNPGRSNSALTFEE